MSSLLTSSAEKGCAIDRRSERRRLITRVEESNRKRYEQLQHLLEDELPFILGERQSAARVARMLEECRLDIIDLALDEGKIGSKTNRSLLGMDVELGHQAADALQGEMKDDRPGKNGLQSMLRDPAEAARSARQKDITAGFTLTDQREILGQTGVLSTQSVSTASSGIITTLASALARAAKMDGASDREELIEAFQGLLERTSAAIRLLITA